MCSSDLTLPFEGIEYIKKFQEFENELTIRVNKNEIETDEANELLDNFKKKLIDEYNEQYRFSNQNQFLQLLNKGLFSSFRC